MYFSKSAFANAGVDVAKWANPAQPTWKEFTEACDALKASGVVPIALGNGDSWPGVMFMWAFQNRFGCKPELEAAVAGKDSATFSGSPGFRKAAESVAALGSSPYLPLGYNGITGGQKYALFTSGTAAIIFQGPWLLGRIASDATADFAFGVFNFPSMDGPASSQQDVVGGFDGLFVTPSAEKPSAIGTFLNSFAEEDVAIDFMRATQNISVVKSASAAGPGPGILNEIATIAGSAPAITPWWDIHDECDGRGVDANDSRPLRRFRVSRRLPRRHGQGRREIGPGSAESDCSLDGQTCMIERNAASEVPRETLRLYGPAVRR